MTTVMSETIAITTQNLRAGNGACNAVSCILFNMILMVIACPTLLGPS